MKFETAWKDNTDTAFYFWNKGLEINPNDKNILENVEKLKAVIY